MNILLINTNPVVSRLIGLCVDKSKIILDEIEDVKQLTKKSYDIVFIDDALYSKEVDEGLYSLSVKQKVLLWNQSKESEKYKNQFDMVISKPFLPSQIHTLFNSIESQNEEKEEEQEVEDDSVLETQILDTQEITKIKMLLSNEDEEILPLSEQEYEIEKVKVIKEQLEADGIEIIDADTYIDSLSKTTRKKKKFKKKHKKLAEDFKKAFLEALDGMEKKKRKKLLKNTEVKINIEIKGIAE